VDVRRLAKAVRTGDFGADFVGAGVQCDAFDFILTMLRFLDDMHYRQHFACGLRTRLRCLHCSVASDTSVLQPYVSLSFPDEAVTAVPLSLRRLWECCFQETAAAVGARCPSAVASVAASCPGPVSQQVFLEREPPILLLRIERGWQLRDPRTGSILHAEKIRREVHFPERIDFLRTGPYALRGVLCHHGSSLTQGHYSAMCWLREDAQTGNVYGVFNDAAPVTPLSWQASNNASVRGDCYALLYVRTGRWASAPPTGVEATPYKRGPVSGAFLASVLAASSNGGGAAGE
jgi:ubiquitin C-terminal hydrolase